ncbi:FtsW/RodA/SpoVE family cell cycle protein [Bacillus sp. BRMEA1]|uniref:FtsW/RodA/SpoVE family cell cycle protein n=1 Tax=Neobacillus endophyticus TaxID=2738405 RepID=UPI001565777E|nr:FtsW/RodA/SpoVE family cell cycle protein [Neobacillus endophyticus]NRD80118.1 FtsW/RodA/SpoVE family cell cycle protein [Neobacillus endophyticus]
MFKKILKSYDYQLISAIFLLSLFGLVMVYSASMAMATQRYGVSSDYFYQKQKLFLIISFFIFIVVSFFPYKILQSRKVLIGLVSCSLLLLLILSVHGHVAGGAQSWIKIGPLSLEPSEFVKLCVIIYLSAIYAKKQAYINEFNKGVVPPLVYLGLVCILIASQPDFGTVELILFFSAAIIMSSGISIKNFIKLGGLCIISAIPIILIFHNKIFTTKRVGRFSVLSDPFATAQTSGYHLVNSYIAIGNGGINGLGLGKSIQKLGYLPEPHTDFIMAVIAEELGIWGVGFVILTLAFIVLKGLKIATRCKDPFGSLLATGISSMIGVQAIVNLAGVSGLLPLAGVPLPFVSYGGSSLIQLAIATGILVNVSMFINYEKNYKTSRSTTNPRKENIYLVKS